MWRPLKTFATKAAAACGYQISAVPPDRTAELYRRFSKESLNRRRFYNFGAGGFSHPYWTNIDFPSEWYAPVQSASFIPYDATTLDPLPLPDQEAEAFYCCHVIEHLPTAAVANFVREALRCLKPGGTLRLVTPDAELEWHAYRNGDVDLFPWAYSGDYGTASLHRTFLNHFASQISQIRPSEDAPPQASDDEIERAFASLPMEEAFEVFTSRCSYDPRRPAAHMNWWTEKRLGGLLAQSGFKIIYRSGYGQSLCPPMRDLRYFDAAVTGHFRHSLFIEAVAG